MDALTLGPYAVGEQPWAISYVDYDTTTGRYRNLIGYEAAVVLRKPNQVTSQHHAEIPDPEHGEVLFNWPTDPFDQAGNWDLEIWLANDQRKFKSALFSFRVAPSLLVPDIAFSEPDPDAPEEIDGGSPSSTFDDDLDGGTP